MKISEMFTSLQGEGLYTGKNTIFIRFFLCNLQCDGFGQDDPTKPETYELPYKTFNSKDIKHVNDLPVFDKGCDSSYSWSAKFKHLIEDLTQEDISKNLSHLLNGTGGKFVRNMGGRFISDTHICFTGGEPMMKQNQSNIIQILNQLELDNNLPNHITFETNATQELTDDFIKMIGYYSNTYDIEFHVSCSPKLFNVSGETNDKAWKHDVINLYNDVFQKISIKFVVNNNEQTWNELDLYLEKLEFYTSNIYIMPVGATLEDQSTISDLCDKGLKRGFNISARVHTYIYGNRIGT